MSSLSSDQIKSLRTRTGVSLQACKKALEEANGDEIKAIDLLRKKGEAKAIERGERTTGEGLVAAYIHTNGKIGVLIQLACETDFVSRSEDFQSLGRDLAMHIAAMNPLFIAPENVPSELIEKEREIWKAELVREGKQKMFEKILQGKEKKFREQLAILTQPFVKNPELSVEKLLADAILKLGENIKVLRFVRYTF